jgi:hypothetical protein
MDFSDVPEKTLQSAELMMSGQFDEQIAVRETTAPHHPRSDLKGAL